ncbi:AbrB family transcriptional regulator [Desulfuribacillus stibiiarsenatis]|uniref:AbrB family transcriptional regulator n=1 Tax=Desulfuribacillus stibiiarsenatis TaxID=1390249 RepID=A0A1E5L369_9FIRM|nr:AbrB family transcriptional regulator [Desulfuribacillus stibiiarsenatis]
MHSHGKCYGSTAMGERGQIVIPAEAREELDIQPGEKMIVFGNARKGTLIIIKSDIMARFADMMMQKASFLEELFGTKKKSNKKAEQDLTEEDDSEDATDTNK